MEGRVAEVLLAVPSEAVCDSVNFVWFKDSYAEFLYVNRVVV